MQLTRPLARLGRRGVTTIGITSGYDDVRARRRCLLTLTLTATSVGATCIDGIGSHSGGGGGGVIGKGKGRWKGKGPSQERRARKERLFHVPLWVYAGTSQVERQARHIATCEFRARSLPFCGELPAVVQREAAREEDDRAREGERYGERCGWRRAVRRGDQWLAGVGGYGGGAWSGEGCGV